MKIKFSNFVKLFLAGASLLAVGCTDYGQDIQNLNDRIDKLETDAIEPLKVDLKAIQDDLAAAKDDLQKKIDANTTLINGVNDDLETAKENIAANKTAVDAVKGDLEKTDALVATINGQVATLVENVAALAEKDAEFAETIKQLQLAISNNTAAIEELKAKNQSLENALNTHVKTYEALVLALQTEVNVLKGQVKDLQDKDAQIDETIAKIDERLKANEELAKQNKANLEAAVETLGILQNAHNVLAGEFKTFSEGVRKELDDHYAAFKAAVERITTLETTQADHANRIAAAEDAIETLKTDVGTLKTDLAQAQSDLADLTKELSDYKEEMKKALEERDGKIQANADAIKKLTDELLPALENRLTEAINAAKTALEAQITALQGNLDALKARIQSIVYVPEYTDGKATIQWASFNGASMLDAQSEFLYQVHPAECAGAISADELTFLFQSLKDAGTRAGAEPELKVVGDVVVENAAKGIIKVTARAYNLNKLYDGTESYAVSLVFNGKTGEKDNEKSEANIASAYTTLALASKAAYDLTWELTGTYKTAEAIEYTSAEAVELLVGVDVQLKKNGENITTAEAEAQFGVAVKPVDGLNAVTYNHDTYGDGKQTKDLFNNQLATPSGYAVSLNLEDTPDKATVGLIETISYSFNIVDTNSDAVLATETATGTVEVTPIETKMTLAPQTITWTRSLDNEVDGITPKNPTHRLVETTASDLLHGDKKVDGTTYENIIAVAPNAVTVNGQALAAPFEVVFGGTNDKPTVDFKGFEWNKEYVIVATYTLPEMEVTMDVTLKTEQKTAEVTLAEQTITWNYANDWTSALVNTDSNYKQTFRAVATTADNADLYAEVIADGIRVDAANEFVFTAAGVEVTGFDWNKPYETNVVYALEDKLVTVNAKINTVKKFLPLDVQLDPVQWTIVKNLVDNTDPESLTSHVYDALKAQEVYADKSNTLGDISAADYLKAIFVTYLSEATQDNKVNGSDLSATKLNIAADGLTISASYNYADFTNDVRKIDYVYSFKTWYGQDIQFTKTITLEFPTYDFKHVPEFVYSTDGYFSVPIPRYFYEPTTSYQLNSLAVDVDMNTAFNIVDTKTGAILTENEIKALGLERVFDFVPGKIPADFAPDHIEFVDNTLRYYGKDEKVYVTAKLMVVNENGTSHTFETTQFENGGDYANYYVKQHNPVETLVGTPLQITLAPDAKVYTYYIANQIQFKDYHNGGYPLLKHGALVETSAPNIEWTDAAWVVGADVEEDGFATGVDVQKLYGIKITSFVCEVPTYLESSLQFTTETGKLVFNNTNQIELTAPITFTVTVHYQHKWKEGTIDVPVTIIP